MSVPETRNCIHQGFSAEFLSGVSALQAEWKWAQNGNNATSVQRLCVHIYPVSLRLKLCSVCMCLNSSSVCVQIRAAASARPNLLHVRASMEVRPYWGETNGTPSVFSSVILLNRCTLSKLGSLDLCKPPKNSLHHPRRCDASRQMLSLNIVRLPWKSTRLTSSTE